MRVVGSPMLLVSRTALVLALLLVGGCSRPGADEPAGAATAGPAGVDVRAVQGARDALGDPMVQLAESVLALAEDLDAARHDVPRGQDAQLALAALDTPAEAVLDAADTADAAAAGLEGTGEPAVAEAAEVVGSAAEQARAAVAAARDERDALVRLAEVDARLDVAVEAWDEPGSQSERRAALAALAAELDAVADRAEGLEPAPDGCPGPWERRPVWARTLAERTRELEATATGTGGTAYDELRAAYGADPFGEDRRAADAADRGCWEETSPVAAAAAAAPGYVEQLEAALNPQR